MGAAIGVAAVGAVFFSQLDAGSGYGHAFMTGVWLEIALLAVIAALTLLLRVASQPMPTSHTSRSPHPYC